MQNTLAFHTLDVFTDRAYAGNPLAVVLEADALSTAQMQHIASEFNLSETVFVLKATRTDADVRVRIFTPSYEMPFAGHPTVGTACLLAALGWLVKETDVLVLEENVGLVPVQLRRPADSQAPWFAELTAAQAPEVRPFAASSSAVAEVLGLSADDLVYEDERPRQASCGAAFVLVPLKQPELLSSIVFDTAKANALLAGAWSHGFHCYARGYEGELRARMFAPGAGVPEDPATGSAAAALVGALAMERAEADGEWAWAIHQGVEMGRPSLIQARAEKKGGAVTAVRVGGFAVPVSEGRLRIPVA